MREAVIVNGLRTPQGKFGGALEGFDASELGEIVIKSLLEDSELRPKIGEEIRKYRPSRFREIERSPVEEEHCDWNSDMQGIELDEVIMGNVLQGGQGQNPARQASIRAGIPREVPAYTVNKVCASGMKTVSLAAQKIISGKADAIIAGGMESMTNAPYVLPKARWGHTMDIDTEGEMKDMMVLDGLYETFYDYHMGMTAENLAEEYDISRGEQDRLSVESQNRALDAIKNDVFQDEIIPIDLGDEIFKKDEAPRDTDLQSLSKLPPVFKDNGTVTAGNSSGVSDGAAALLVTSRELAEENGLDIMASFKESATAGVDPQYMGLGPVPATNKLLDKTETEEEEIDLTEENEAFAAQTLAVMEELDVPKYGVGIDEEGAEDINPHGSGISLGHPIGCTGARMIVTLVHGLKRRKDDKGLASLCIGGGMGMAVMVERG